MTSLLRELMPVPKVSADSSRITSWPSRASRPAIAKPITPAPTTTQSIASLIRRSLSRSGVDRPRTGNRHRNRRLRPHHARFTMEDVGAARNDDRGAGDDGEGRQFAPDQPPEECGPDQGAIFDWCQQRDLAIAEGLGHQQLAQRA